MKDHGRGHISVRATTHDRLKAGAAAKNKSIAQVIEEGVERLLDEHDRTAQAVDSPPRQG